MKRKENKQSENQNKSDIFFKVCSVLGGIGIIVLAIVGVLTYFSMDNRLNSQASEIVSLKQENKNTLEMFIDFKKDIEEKKLK